MMILTGGNTEQSNFASELRLRKSRPTTTGGNWCSDFLCLGLYFAPLCGYFLFVIITIRERHPCHCDFNDVFFSFERIGLITARLRIFIDIGVISEMLHQNHVTLDYTAALLRLVTWEQRGVSLVSGSAM
jgi:hypothetical protein